MNVDNDTALLAHRGVCSGGGGRRHSARKCQPDLVGWPPGTHPAGGTAGRQQRFNSCWRHLFRFGSDLLGLPLLAEPFFFLAALVPVPAAWSPGFHPAPPASLVVSVHCPPTSHLGLLSLHVFLSLFLWLGWLLPSLSLSLCVSLSLSLPPSSPRLPLDTGDETANGQEGC